MSAPTTRQTALGAQRTLVLNRDWTPLEVWDWREAVCALVRGAASVAASYDVPVRSPGRSFALPSVLVRNRYVRMDRPAALTRRNVFLAYAELRPAGLAWRCALCGTPTGRHELTFDHVVPRCRGGRSEWGNVRRARDIVLPSVQRLSKAIYSLTEPSDIAKLLAAEEGVR